MDLQKLSRAISYALRHEPWIYELELDEEGWTSLDALLISLRSSEAAWQQVGRADIERMIAMSPKQRHEIDAHGRIRARYGHSIPGKLQRKPSTPPPLLFHGTAPSALEGILSLGLLPMGRQYVHLSVDRDTAREVGQRKARAPTLLQVDASAASAAGVVFYAGNEKVWLADTVPAQFVRDLGAIFVSKD